MIEVDSDSDLNSDLSISNSSDSDSDSSEFSSDPDSDDSDSDKSSDSDPDLLSIPDTTYNILKEAAINNDVHTMREKLGCCPIPKFWFSSLMILARKENNLEMIKLLIQHGANVVRKTAKKIFQLENSRSITRTVIDIFNFNKTTKTIGRMFCGLLESYKNQSKVDILKIMLNYGMPINGFIYYRNCNYTPLHVSIKKNRIDYVSQLLKLGADIHKNSKNGFTCLELAVLYSDEFMVKLLLDNGAKINERNNDGFTVLNLACTLNRPRVIYLLLKYGAHISVSINRRCNAFNNHAQEILIKQLAILKFECQTVNVKNLEYVQKYKDLHKFFKETINELKKMKNYQVHNGFTSYDIFKLRQNHKKLILLLKNEEFVKAFQSPRNLKRFRIFGKDLDNIFKMALKRRDVLQSQMKKIHESGLAKEFCLPNEIVEMIAYFASCKTTSK